MNSFEKVMATAKGIKQESTPVSLLLSLYGAKLTGYPLIEHYNNSAKYVEGLSAVVDSFHPDILFTPFAYAIEAEAFGGTARYFEKAPPNITKYAVKSVDEMIDLPIPDILNNPKINYFNESTRLMVQQFGKEFVVTACFLGPLDLPILAMGIDLWLETLMLDPKKAMIICEKMSEYFVQRTNCYFEMGAHLVGLPMEICSPLIVPNNIINEIAVPVMKQAFSKIKGQLVLHNGGHALNSSLDSFSSFSNIAGIVVDSTDSLDEARKIIGEEKILLGNIDGPTINNFSTNQIKKQCQEILNNRKNDHHFILHSSSADVPFDTPKENIMAMIECAREFRYADN